MIDIDKTPEQQLYSLEFLVDFIDHRNPRKRVKKTLFKILNAIYLFTKHNENLGRQKHFPSMDTIASMSKCGRDSVSKFINSKEIELFCSIKRNKFTSHEYILKDWVYEWFRLFWRSGMMKSLHIDDQVWRKTFKKRLNNWLIPIAQSGVPIRQIYEGVVNKLSTEKVLKPVTTKSLKPVTINPAEPYEAFQGSRTNTGSCRIAAIRDVNCVAKELSHRFSIKDGDINWLINNLSLKEVKSGIRIRSSMICFNPNSPIKGFMHCVKKHRMEKKNARRNSL